ncbi:FMN-binding protein [Konateibacter massiliensis]|uniref:FMN-binding protein n=1 Tax=Konateibacter massiliensis TaxID=2002841 RepID=UPI000C15C27D|nr:FMN-binding protein [Konateibacter massiliensis]
MAEVTKSEAHHDEAHVQKEYTILQVALNLAIVCIVSGLIIAVTYFITAPIALQKNAELEKQAMQNLVEDATDFVEVTDKADWYAAQKSGETIAYIVPAEIKGYGGIISMLVAVSIEDRVLDYKILSANETPGLGDNASKLPFRSQFEGKIAAALVVTKDKSNTQNIQALTGATITSEAVTKAVRTAQESVVAYMGGN